MNENMELWQKNIKSDHELTVTITLAEYRELIAYKAIRDEDQRRREAKRAESALSDPAAPETKAARQLTLEEALDAPIVWATDGAAVFPCRLDKGKTPGTLEVQRFGRLPKEVPWTDFFADWELYADFPKKELEEGAREWD